MKRILITPLNWGLGHATRCMPIINEFLEQGAEVIIGTDGRAFHLLKKEYPSLEILELPAYDISYGSSNMMLNIAPQLYKIFKAIQREHRLIQKIVRERKIDIIISDNRYGCYSKNAHSIFITHQLNIKIPNWLVERGVAFFNKILINRFDESWIPDYEEEEKCLSGTLSKRNGLKNIKYIGALTRMQFLEKSIKNDLLIILSGPEPQRTFLEEKLLEQIARLSLKTIFVKGKTNLGQEIEKRENLTIHNFMTAQELNTAILESEVIVTRSGYSTIMDLAVLGKKAILIPTPGQTEQEYLADYFYQKKIYHFQHQKELNLIKAIEEVKGFKGLELDKNNTLMNIIRQILQKKQS